jgi:hypothetical protein
LPGLLRRLVEKPQLRDRCVLAAIAITLKVKLDTPQEPQPLARAIMTIHLQQLRGELALP